MSIYIAHRRRKTSNALDTLVLSKQECFQWTSERLVTTRRITEVSTQLTANSKSLVQWQRRTDDQVSWVGNAPQEVDRQSVVAVYWPCQRLAYHNQVLRGFVLLTPAHCYAELVLHTFWNVQPVQVDVQQTWQTTIEFAGTTDKACSSIQRSLKFVCRSVSPAVKLLRTNLISYVSDV